MGLFKSFKKMLAPIGGVVGFALGGPMGAALGSGIGSLAGGGDVKDALLAGALGYGAGSFAKSAGFGLGSGSGMVACFQVIVRQHKLWQKQGVLIQVR